MNPTKLVTNTNKALWEKGDFTQIADTMRIYPPPTGGICKPDVWGVENHVIQRFANDGIPTEKICFTKAVASYLVTVRC